MGDGDDGRRVAVVSQKAEAPEVGVGTKVLAVCLTLTVGLPLVGIGAGVAVVLFRGITGL